MKRTVAAAALLLLVSSPAVAASPDQAATDMSAEIMSPFCPGVTLHECPSAEALRLRDRIETWFRDGMTRDQVLDRLETEYGSGIRATPSGKGFGLVAWLVVAGAVLAALATGSLLLRKWLRRGEETSPDQTLVADAERRRLDEELARLRTQS